MVIQLFHITKDGLDKLKKELEELTTIKRREVAEWIRQAKELGDLSENAEYAGAKEEQAFTEGRIVELKNMISKAVVVKKHHHGQEIDLGSRVKLLTEKKTEQEFTIVGPNESDPTKGRISEQSPLGSALLGKKPGDEFKVKVPKGEIHYKILEIS